MSAALDASAQALARRLLREHPATRPYVRADLDALPGPVARILAARLDRHVEQAAPASPWVDADAPAVRDAARQWREAARAAARIPADAWAEALERAARLALAHLVRPAETLAAHAFENHDGPLPAADAVGRLDAFGPYPYLPDIAARYVERKGLDQIDRPGLERLLRRIDQRMVSAFGAADWADLLAPLVDLVGPDGDPSGAVPATLVRELAEAKDAPALAAALDGAEPLTADELRPRLAAALGEPAAPAPSVTEPPPPPKHSADAAPGPLDDASDVAPMEMDASPADGDAPDETPSAGSTVHVPDPPDAPVTKPPAPDAERQEPVPPAPGTAASAASRAPEAPEVTPSEEPRPAPPVIGSQYRPPTDAPALDSDVIGTPRPAAARPEPPGVVFDATSDDDPAPADPVVPRPVPLPASPASAPPTAPASAPPPGSASDDDEPLWRRFARDPDVAPSHATAATEDEVPIWQRFLQEAPATPPPDEEETPPPPPGGLGPLEDRVLGPGADDRRGWFVEGLFGGSADDYHRTLAALDDARTWTEATQIIGRDVFRKHSVNIYSEPAVAFTDAVEAQMTARGKG